jgi:tRNA G46 methylase TrmB
MLEKLNDPAFRTVSRPDGSVMNYLGEILTYEANPVVYEIGVGVGATTLSVAKLLNNHGKIVLFSREKDVRELAADLNNEGFNNIESSWGSPNKITPAIILSLPEDLLKVCCRRSILPISMAVTSFILMAQLRAY